MLVVPAAVPPELAHLLRRRLGAAEELAVEALGAADYRRCEELMRQYHQIGLVDASVVALAERLDVGRVLTTDRRHFSMVRPRHVEALEFLP